MMLNQNEKYLLKFISSYNNSINENNLVELVCKLGIKLQFKSYNPVHQIIDELDFSSRYSNIRK